MSTLRTRFGIPGIIATVALVFAMTGGAFAAKYLITSTKQISPSVLKKLKGATGPAGANGAAGAPGSKGDAGAAGAQGAAGSKGADGTKGADGAKGKSVKVTPADPTQCNEFGGAIVEAEGSGTPIEVCNGEEGEQGKEGSPWTAGGTLPPGATETGTWATNGTSADTKGVLAPISFPIPLSGPLAGAHVHFNITDADFETFCGFSGFAPTAKPGELCVYRTAVDENSNAKFSEIAEVGFSAIGASRTGALLGFTMKDVGFAAGTFAVTGCAADDPEFPCP